MAERIDQPGLFGERNELVRGPEARAVDAASARELRRRLVNRREDPVWVGNATTSRRAQRHAAIRQAEPDDQGDSGQSRRNTRPRPCRQHWPDTWPHLRSAAACRRPDHARVRRRCRCSRQQLSGGHRARQAPAGCAGASEPSWWRVWHHCQVAAPQTRRRRGEPLARSAVPPPGDARRFAGAARHQRDVQAYR